MAAAVVFVQGLFELAGLGSFLIGYFGDTWWLMVLGGCLVVLDDIIEISMEVLNPLFPIVLAIVLAIVLTPWYVGVFWASAAFKVLGIPASLTKMFAPKQFVARALQRTQSGSRGIFSPSPHTTRHAGPHRAVHEDYRAVAG